MADAHFIIIIIIIGFLRIWLHNHHAHPVMISCYTISTGIQNLNYQNFKLSSSYIIPITITKKPTLRTSNTGYTPTYQDSNLKSLLTSSTTHQDSKSSQLSKSLKFCSKYCHTFDNLGNCAFPYYHAVEPCSSDWTIVPN